MTTTSCNYEKTQKSDNSFFFIPSACQQEPMICQFLRIIIYIGVCGAFPHMSNITKHYITLYFNIVLLFATDSRKTICIKNLIYLYYRLYQY